MNNKNKDYKIFGIFVILFVILTGAGFGVMTGRAYSEEYWWVAAIIGLVSGYPLAKLYLKRLVNLTAKGYRKKIIWFLSTLFAVGCGIICTTLAHGAMIFLVLYNADKPIDREIYGFWPMIFMIGEAIGAGAGLIVGGICSLVYVLSLRVKSHETA